jgi:hypothetical protein
VVREGVGAGGEMNQVLYAHMNNKRKMKKKIKKDRVSRTICWGWLQTAILLISAS